MLKLLRARFARAAANWFKTHHSDYKKFKVSLSGTSLAGCDVYSKEVDTFRRAWIAIGGTADDSSFTTELYWTTEGVPWDEVQGWDWRRSPAIPKSGGRLQLTDEPLVGDDLFDGSRLIEVRDPPIALQDEAIRAASTTDLYRRVREMTITDMRRANPAVTMDEIEKLLARADRIEFGLWGSIAKAIEIPDHELDRAIEPALNKVFHLLDTYGFSFLEKRLSG